MEGQILNIQNAIIEKEKFQDFECQICFSIALKPVECVGPCHKRFCVKCVSDWKMLQDKCPLKCSQPFFVCPTQSPSMTFQCPYSSTQCTSILKSIHEFQSHFTQCKFITQNQLLKCQLKQSYKCFRQHELEFFLGTYEQMCSSVCASCKQVKLCRSICRKCNELYCVFCRPPLCSKKGCPLGHKLNYQKWNQIGYICDMCGVSTAITNRGVYDDPVCNFGLCEQCFSQLPEDKTHPFKFKNPYMCNNNHELITEFPQNQKKACLNCQKVKYCPKKCLTCFQRYCLQCKAGVISETRRCQQNHEFNFVKNSLYEQNEQKECIRCLKWIQTGYQDCQCKFTICESCFDYEGRILDNKNRFIEKKDCKNGHLLKFYSGSEEFLNKCCSCNQNKVIRLYCGSCSRDQKAYCCSCRSLSNTKVCYFGHSLDEVSKKQAMNCNKCGDFQYKMRKCHKCNYSICLECYNENESYQNGS